MFTLISTFIFHLIFFTHFFNKSIRLFRVISHTIPIKKITTADTIIYPPNSIGISLNLFNFTILFHNNILNSLFSCSKYTPNDACDNIIICFSILSPTFIVLPTIPQNKQMDAIMIKMELYFINKLGIALTNDFFKPTAYILDYK